MFFLGVLLGLVVLGIGFWLGVSVEENRKGLSSVDQSLICGCGHHKSYHSGSFALGPRVCAHAGWDPCKCQGFVPKYILKEPDPFLESAKKELGL